MQQLQSILGSTGLCSFAELEPALQQQITSTLSGQSAIDGLVCPQTSTELAAVMAQAHRHKMPVLPMGAGSKLSWGGLASGVRLAVSTKNINQLIDHAAGDLTVTAEAGMTFSQLQQILAAAGQFLPLDPPFAQTATLGGIVATASAGSQRQRYGGVRDLLIGFSFVRADGEIAKAGGRVVKNVAGYDLMKLFTGSYGTLAIICQVTFRVYPIPDASQTLLLMGTSDSISQITKTLLASALTPTSADLLSPQLVHSLGVANQMGLLVRFQSVPASVRQQSEQLLQAANTLGLKSSCWDTDDSSLWQQLKDLMWQKTPTSSIVCKIGVRPSESVAFLSRISSFSAVAQVHLGSGLGVLQFSAENGVDVISKLRLICEEMGGFLTVLQGPVSVKQSIDVWGYKGNALTIMRQIKKQFDGEDILSPGRFVGGI